MSKELHIFKNGEILYAEQLNEINAFLDTKADKSTTDEISAEVEKKADKTVTDEIIAKAEADVAEINAELEKKADSLNID